MLPRLAKLTLLHNPLPNEEAEAQIQQGFAVLEADVKKVRSQLQFSVVSLYEASICSCCPPVYSCGVMHQAVETG